MPFVCSIKFRGTGKVYYFAPGDLTDLRVGDHVIVETARGREMGQVAAEIHEVGDGDIVGQLKPIIRRATTSDLLDAQRYQRQEAEAVEKCKEQVARYNLPMKMVGAEYSYDGSRLTFFFTSEQRVDFRELVRELARIFRVRIELRQIGVRDEAKSVGGIGKCGRPLCCATWLNEFCPVSIRMAKQQDLPLSPMEISGLCGRLLCCLGYENDYYQSVKGRFPKVGKMISTPIGPAKVIGVSVLREKVELLFEDGSTAELTADELAGKVPIHQEDAEALSAEQTRVLDEVVAEANDLNGDGREPRGGSERGPSQAERSPDPRRGDANGPQGQRASRSGSASGRSRRRRSRRPRGSRPAEPQGEAAAQAKGTTNGQERPKSSRRRSRRRPRKTGGSDQGGAPSQKT